MPRNHISIYPSISTASKGSSANLLQSGSKRRRTKKQIEEEKKAKLLKEQQSAAKIAQYDALKIKVSMMEAERDKGNAAADLISQFLDAGFVKQGNDGSFNVPGANMNKKFKPFQNLMMLLV